MRRFRPTPALVIACLALAVSLGGSAFAATMLVPKNSVGSAQVIDGSLQRADLSKKAVAALKGKRGPQGLEGLPGSPGAAGPTGPKGEKGPPGDPWAGNGTVASGKTLRGVFGPGGTATDPDSLTQETVSFGFIFAGVLTVHYIGVGEAAPTQCPGTITQPEAQPGHLCVYTARAENVSTVCVFNPVNDNCGQTSGRGFGVAIESTAAGDYWLQGSWAVTAT